MPAVPIVEQLATYGPGGTAGVPAPAEASEYCRRLATSHYENFSVVGRLLPRELRRHVYHIYAYCRWADDLSDEVGDPERSLALLAWWEEELRACYAGEARHPVFVALAATIREFEIPPDPFLDLLVAFRQDQRRTRYETFDELVGYCKNSADPVGRLVLYLGRACDDERAALSDSICTGLQLANFWQDVTRDFAIGRVYLPQEDLVRFGVVEQELTHSPASMNLRALLKFEVERAEAWLQRGLPLVDRMPRALAGDVWLFAQGGLKILAKIRRLDYDVVSRRPKVSKLDQLQLLVGCLWRNRFGGSKA
ncbi:MAG: squalene synthase HpnC [Planctomycetia bacterium]|nr:squalene synthase HpnC [Planctomycetia bacterium]